MNVRDIFLRENIEYVAALDLTSDDIRRPDILLRCGLSPENARCALVFLIPYYVIDGEGNVSLYARARDYHAFCDGLFLRVTAALEEEFGGTFIGFADKSPIEETQAALRAGLCVRGEGTITIQLKPTVLDGSEIRLEAKGTEITVVVAPATHSIAQVVEQSKAQFEQTLAERIPSFQVTVSIEAVKTASRRKANTV